MLLLDACNTTCCHTWETPRDSGRSAQHSEQWRQQPAVALEGWAPRGAVSRSCSWVAGVQYITGNGSLPCQQPPPAATLNSSLEHFVEQKLQLWKLIFLRVIYCPPSEKHPYQWRAINSMFHTEYISTFLTRNAQVCSPLHDFPNKNHYLP